MSRSEKILLIAALVAGVLLGLMSWLIQNRIAAEARAEVGRSLSTVVDTTHQAVKSWLKETRSAARIWANSPQVYDAAQQLLASSRSQPALLAAPAQDRLRAWFRPLQAVTGYQGYFIIAPDNTNLASSRDQNVGVENLMAPHETTLRRVWSGMTTVGLPEKSDVALRDSDGRLREGLPTMFVVAPILGEHDEVIAGFALRINPGEDFTTILQQGRLGQSGETYALDGKARLISNSRFEAQLRRIGLIAADQRAILNITIRDPGADLTQGGPGPTPLEQQSLTHMAADVVAGNSGLHLEGYRDYRGVSVVGAWIWDSELGLGIATEIDIDEAYGTLRATRQTLLFLTTLILLLLPGLTLIYIVYRQRLRAERALREGEAKYRQIFESILDVYAEIGLDGTVLEVSPSSEAQTGFAREELLGRNMATFYARPGDREKLLERLYRDGMINDYEATLVDASGAWRPFSFTGKIIKDADGKPLKLAGVMRDISDRKRAEEALRIAHDDLEIRVQQRTAELAKASEASKKEVSERRRAEAALKDSEQKFRAIFEQAAMGVAVIETRSGRFASINRKFSDIIGYSEEESATITFPGITHPDDRPAERDYMRRLVEGSMREFSLEKRVHRKDGSIVWINMTVSPMWNIGEQPAFHIAIVEDTAQRRAAEERARQHQAELAHMARLNTMGEMATGIAHELNQPLMAITTYSDAALRMAHAGITQPDKLNEALEGARAQAARAAEIIRHLRQFVRKHKPQKTDTDLNALVNEVVGFIQGEVRKQGIGLLLQLDEGLPLVPADAIQIEQVLLNLLRNALEAMQPASVQVRELTITTCLNVQGLIQCAVADTGPGIDAESLRHIFESFVTSKGAQGMGMGLSISRSIVEAHGGRLWVESESGQGATFFFTLPADGQTDTAYGSPS